MPDPSSVTISPLTAIPPDSPRSPAPIGFDPSRVVELLPDPVLPAVVRPLTVAGPHTYAAIWPLVRRADLRERVARELVLVRGDGLLCLSNSAARNDSRTVDLPGDQLPQTDDPLFADTPLPLDRAPLPLDRFLSDRGLQAYLAGRRPDPADLFRRLVAVLSHFMDFSGLSGSGQESVAEFLAVYVLSTWFAPALPTLGFLWLVGDHGSGKSRLLYLLARLAHLGLLLHALPSAPALAALCGLGAAVAVDDAGFLSAGRMSRSRGVGSARRALLLAGRQRGALLPVFRRVAGGAARSTLIDVSGPRLFTCTHPPDPSIAASCLVVPLLRTADDARAALDPADPSAWPSGIVLRDLVDDLWAMSLSRIPELPPQVLHSAQSTSVLRQSFTHIVSAPMPGAAYQPWHSLFAVAYWLTAQGVTALADRLILTAQNYRADRSAFETTDLTTLVLRGLFECANAHLIKLRSAARARDGRDARDTCGIGDTRDIGDRGDVGDVGDIPDPDREIGTPGFYPFTSSQILVAVQRLAVEAGSQIHPARLTSIVVGQLLSHLGLQRYRTNQQRMWSLTPAQLTRLARAYGESPPPELAVALDQAAAAAAREPSPSPLQSTSPIGRSPHEPLSLGG